MLRAAFSSRSRISPQWVQTCVRAPRLLGTRAPRLLQSWDECAGLTASTHLPAHAALHAKIVKIVRNWLRPVSWMDISDRRAEDLYLKRRLKQLKRLHR